MRQDIIKRIKGYNHTALTVSDWDRSMKFYQALGFRFDNEWYHPSGNGWKMAMLTSDCAGQIEFFDRGRDTLPDADARMHTPGCYYRLCYEVNSAGAIDELYERALSAGGSENMPPRPLEGSENGRAAAVYGPDSEVIMFLYGDRKS